VDRPAVKDELQALREQMAADLSALTAECDLPLQDAAIVRDYLEHDEFAIGLEHLCDILIETESDLTKPQYNKVLAIAAALKLLGTDEWSERIVALAARVK
jgi:hypothetical protein